MESLDKIKTWLSLQQSSAVKTTVKARKKPGYIALFDGPGAADKLAQAELLSKNYKKKVFRVDLTQAVKKYIGETEKNINAIFKKAVGKDCILFFDEADALFGKRTDVGDAHDKYTTAEISYLMEKIEAYPGLVIVATNNKSNIDSSFICRFRSVLHFPDK